MTTTRMIGHYQLGELLGEGGIGHVHAARDTVLEREVAIKSLRAELLNDKSFVDRFRAEATNLARLNHPNVTTLYSLLPEGNRLYMIMELVRGRTLEAVLQERGAPFSAQEVLAIVSQAADGLSYAHEMGLIHRDIKPANLIITNTGLLKIMDFGIARVQGSQRMTRDGSVVGTLAYMAPEQLRGQEVDARADLYSLAIVAYEMLTGTVPFAADSDYELMQAQIHNAPDRPSRRVPGIEPRLESAVMRALAKKPADRFPSVAAFKDALGASLTRSEAVTLAQKATRVMDALAAAPPAVTALSKSAGRSPIARGLAIGAAAALVLAGALIFFWPGRAPTPPATQVAVPSDHLKPSGMPSAQPSGPRPQSNPFYVDSRAPASAPPPPSGSARPPEAPSPIVPTIGPRAPVQRPFEIAAEPLPTTRPAANGPVVEAAKPPPSPSAPQPQPAPPATAAAVDAAKPEAAAGAPVEAPKPAPAPAAAAAADGAARQDTQAVSGGVTGPEGASRGGAEGARDTAPGASVWVRTAGAAAEAASAPAQAAGPGTVVAAGSPASRPAEMAPAATASPADTRPPASKPTEKDVLAAYEQKNYAIARELAEPLARESVPEAQFIMGRLYETGMSVPKDAVTAAEWYRKAADAGLAKARFNLGVMYYTGTGVLKDRRTAAEWFFKAAQQGHQTAQFNLADMYDRGDGIGRDTAEARRWYAEAAKGSDAATAQEAEEAMRRRRR
jgi:serine/threonine protein kinase/TPR repeat protein